VCTSVGFSLDGPGIPGHRPNLACSTLPQQAWLTALTELSAHVRWFSAVLTDTQDPDTQGLLNYVHGVRVGVGVRMPRAPAACPRKCRRASPSQAHHELLEDFDFAELRHATAPEVGDRRVDTCLPARPRRVPGRDPAAPGRFADVGSCFGRPGCRERVLLRARQHQGIVPDVSTHSAASSACA